MIKNYRDHAANERTFLAWVRTGITVMMLGFLVEKFEIFLAAVAVETHGASSVPHHAVGNQLVSLTMVALGIIMISAATLRFFRTGRELDADRARPFRGWALGLGTFATMTAFGLYLLAYLLQLT